MMMAAARFKKCRLFPGRDEIDDSLEQFTEFCDFINLISEPLAKLLKARGNGHSGQAKRDPESRIFKQFWIPAFAGMTY